VNGTPDAKNIVFRATQAGLTKVKVTYTREGQPPVESQPVEFTSYELRLELQYTPDPPVVFANETIAFTTALKGDPATPGTGNDDMNWGVRPATWHLRKPNGEETAVQGLLTYNLTNDVAGTYQVYASMRINPLVYSPVASGVILYEMRITQPKKEANTVESFLSTLPYRFDHQFAGKDVPNWNQLNYKPGNIKAEARPDNLTFNWSVTKGTITPQLRYEGGKTYQYLAPEATVDVSDALLRLRCVETERTDERTLMIYRDHLARDSQNFQHARQCAPQIELPTGAIGAGPKISCNLTCGPALSHAERGLDQPATATVTQLKSAGWMETVYDWNAFKSLSIPRGAKLQLGYYDYWYQVSSYVHWQTSKEPGSGETIPTYAGDDRSNKFRHETPADYLYYFFSAPEAEGHTEGRGWFDANVLPQCRVRVLIPP